MGHFDFKRMEFRRAGEVVELSKVKEKLLQVLVQNRGHTLPWAVLAQLVWPEDTEPSAFSMTLKERLARCFYPAILESFNNEEDQKAFAAWQAEQARCSAKEKQDVPVGERPAIHRQLFSSWVRPSGRTHYLLKFKFDLFFWRGWFGI